MNRIKEIKNVEKGKKLSFIYRKHLSFFLYPFYFLLLSAFLISGCTETGAKEYRVRKIVDGDTIELAGGERVRYIGIDTPETMKRTAGGWIPVSEPWGKEAKEFNRNLVEGKKVILEFDVTKRDKYGRLLAYVYVEDVMVNLALVTEGLAKVYTFPPNVKYYDQFLSAQKEAQSEGRGMWSGEE